MQTEPAIIVMECSKKDAVIFSFGDMKYYRVEYTDRRLAQYLKSIWESDGARLFSHSELHEIMKEKKGRRPNANTI